MKYKDIDKAIQRLQELSQLEGTELGEAWDKLIYMFEYTYCFSSEFNKAVTKEILRQAEEADECFEIVEEEMSSIPQKRKVLKRKND